MKAKFMTLVLCVIVFMAGVGIGYIIPGPGAPTTLPRLQGEIPIGGLAALSGPLFASFGIRAKTAMEIAQDEINEFVKAIGLDVTFRFYIEDTENKAEATLAKFQSLAARGIKVVVGGMSSFELKAVVEYANSHKIVVIDGSSVAPRSAVAPPGGYIFRTLPSAPDFETVGLVKAIVEKGYKYVGCLVTIDTYCLAIQDAFTELFEAAGGKVIARIEYQPGTQDFSAELDALEAALIPAVNEYGADKVAVLANTWEDVTLILNQAAGRNSPLLDLVWWGPDALALSTVIIEGAGSLAAKVRLLSAVFEAPPSPKLDTLLQKGRDRIGQELDIYSIATYDSAWIAALSILVAGEYNSEKIRATVPYVAAMYYGANGFCILNEAGDKNAQNVVLYGVVEEQGEYKWVKFVTYDASTKELTWLREL